jgi:hypothetical protein
MPLSLLGCGEPSIREYKNRRELEALLTAVSLRNVAELAKDARRIIARHDSGELSDTHYRDLMRIVERARAGSWAEAESLAYDFRQSHPFFK